MSCRFTTYKYILTFKRRLAAKHDDHSHRVNHILTDINVNPLNPAIYGHADCDHSRHDACDHSPHHGDDHDGCVMTNCDVLHAACDAKSSPHLDRTRHTMPHTCTELQNCTENTQHTKPSLKRTRNTFYQYPTEHIHYTIHTIPHVCIVFHHRYLHISHHHY